MAGSGDWSNLRWADSSKLSAMNRIPQLRRVPAGDVPAKEQAIALATGLLLGLTLAASGQLAHAQNSASSAPREGQKPLVIKPDTPGLARNHRLILKDGTYQLVRKYNIAGDRVRFLSLERGDWEEIPIDLVDWKATEKWERDHAGPYSGSSAGEEPSPAMKEAAEVDKEEAEERALMKAQMPEVAPGLELPNQDSVFVLDTFQGTPELVELTPNDLNIDNKAHKGLQVLNPLAMSKMNLQLNGQHAKVHIHVNDPTLYVSLGVVDNKESVLSHAMTVDTGRANAVTGERGAHSDKSGFAIVRLDERRALRYVGAIKVSPLGKISQEENVIPIKIEVLPGKHWLHIQPEQKLLIGEYALVEIISPSEINQSVWDFSVNPATPHNPGSIGPILDQPGEH